MLAYFEAAAVLADNLPVLQEDGHCEMVGAVPMHVAAGQYDVGLVLHVLRYSHFQVSEVVPPYITTGVADHVPAAAAHQDVVDAGLRVVDTYFEKHSKL